MTDTSLPPVLFLMGPTAAGKSGLALRLFDALPVEIISVDSAMVYRGLDIGTAKPSPQVRARVPHALIDICDATEAYSAGRFRADASRLIGGIRQRGRMPLLVGGTGLYFRALHKGLSALPGADPVIRKRLLDEAARRGWDALYRRLGDIDPVAARRIHRNDPQRIQRALEVYEITGKTLSEHFAAGRNDGFTDSIVKLVVAPASRDELRQRIQARFDDMLAQGFLNEAETLYRRPDLGPDKPAMRLVGYRQAWRHLAGEIDSQVMRRLAVTATRQLAKRQLTWLRREEGAEWFDSSDPHLADKVLKFMQLNTKFAIRV